MTTGRMFALAGLGGLLWVLIALVVLATCGCATAPGPRGISADLDDRLRDLATWPLPVRCQAVTDAQRRCARAGLPAGCAWDGWHDADHDAWTIAACLARAEGETP